MPYKCRIEYTSTSSAPDAALNEEEAANASPVVRHVYSVTMPDGQVVEGYGVSGTYVPLDGEYDFTGVLREDGGYNITVSSMYIPTSPEDVHETSRGEYDSEKAFATQTVSDFVWTPLDESYVPGAGGDNSDNANGNENTPGSTNENTNGNTNDNDGFDNANSNPGQNGDTDDEDDNNGGNSFDTPDDVTSMTADEKLSIKYPDVPENPMKVEACAHDSKTNTGEGCAEKDETAIHVAVDYENLFADAPFTVTAKLTNARDGSTLVNSQGQELILAQDFKTPVRDASDKFNTARAQQTVDAYIQQVESVLAIAAAIPDVPDNIPSIDEVKTVVNDASTTDPTAIAKSIAVLEPLYFFAEACGADSAKELAPVQSVIDATSELYAAQEYTKLADGTFEGNISLEPETVAGKTVAVKVELIYDGNVVSSLPADPHDSMYLVSYPSVECEATIRGVHEAKAEAGTVIIDTVKYENLVPGVQYHLDSTVLDLDTQSVVLDDKTKEEVHFMTEFVPEKSSGVINVIFPDFDSSSMRGRQAAVTERIFRCETNVTDTNKDQGEDAASANANNETSNIKHSSQKGTLVAVSDSLDNPLAQIDFNQEISLAETGSSPDLISEMGDTPRPYILGGLIITSLLAIGFIRIRRNAA